MSYGISLFRNYGEEPIVPPLFVANETPSHGPRARSVRHVKDGDIKEGDGVMDALTLVQSLLPKPRRSRKKR